MKKLSLFSLLLCLLVFSSCDGGGGTRDCFTDEELIASDCPANELSNMCTPFFCNALIPGDPPLAADFALPPCGLTCLPIDCSTIQCQDTQYNELTVEINPQGGLELSGFVDGEVEFSCFSRFACN